MKCSVSFSKISKLRVALLCKIILEVHNENCNTQNSAVFREYGYVLDTLQKCWCCIA